MINKEVKVLMELESFTKGCVCVGGGVTTAGTKKLLSGYQGFKLRITFEIVF